MSNDLNLDKHISQKYNEDLEALRQDVTEMGALVESQLKNALVSFMTADLDLAKLTIGNDKAINEKELAITQRSTEILALRQPTASDLRLVLTVNKTITDLERMADLSKHLAKMSKKLINKGLSTHYCVDLAHLADIVQKMFSQSLDAFVRLDAEAAIEVMGVDNDIDREFDNLSRNLITHMMEDPRVIKPTLRVLNAARALERIGAHCENLCEYTIYLVKGEDIRYQDYDEVRDRILGDLDD